MKKDITEFISDKSREQNLIERFSKLVKQAKSKEEIRELEMRLLRPKPLEPYKGKRPGQTTFKKRSLILTFKSPEPIKTWAKYFRINTYIDNNTYDLDFLIELFRLMETGAISWDQKQKKYFIKMPDMFKESRKIKRRKK